MKITTAAKGWKHWYQTTIWTQSISNITTITELRESIEMCCNTAESPDRICYEFIKHLPQEFLEYLLHIFIKIWINGEFPKTWKQTTIIQTPKPAKDHVD